MTVLAIFGTVVGIVSVARIDLSTLTMSLGLAFYLGSIVVFGVVRIVAWAYLTAAAAGGAAAGEEPTAGWRLATLGGALVLLALFLVNIGGLFEIPDQTLDTLYGYVTIVLYALGLLFLLLAFVVRLPALDDATQDDDDAGRRRKTTKTRTTRPPASAQARSVGRAATRLRRKLRPSSTCSIGA